MSKPRRALPAGCPTFLKEKSFRVELSVLGDGRIQFCYDDGTERVPIRRRTIEELRAEFDRIADIVLKAKSQSEDLSAEDTRIYIAARAALAPHGLAVDAAAREVADARKVAGDVSIADLARFWVTRNPRLVVAPPAVDILAELLAELRERNRSAIHISGLERDLTPFATTHPDLGVVTARDVAAYLRTRGTISTRRRDNIRDAIVRLFRFARVHSYLAEDRTSEAEKVPRIDDGVGEVTTYSPAKIRILLANIGSQWRPWFLLAAFAGLRTSEIFRLEWSAIDWENGLIGVGKRIARKIKLSRKVPILPNLAEWLQDYRLHHGPIYPNQQTHGMGSSWHALETRHSRALKSLTAACGISWESNALRHSYGSHRLAVIKSEPQLVVEMGNSISQVREHYHDPKSAAEAESYFAIRPSAGAEEPFLPLQFAAKS